ncbi:THAP domain-containing protein 5-like [Erpetoichthys calabaricus]|uniref:THAP domain-containing protein 5 n=1 Tax=Erpetoichthys calabaricus TaxID=27687 RepID=A0A8C4RI37_ERPCA|nr:THAP domain-containing protein 5-like [Erpetoichthys calabaricus]
MPRYCAADCCQNRGGVSSKDNRKISFYPFPLQDKERLKNWVMNMKRENWVPSKHQYLCSDHFTADSFDIRWGIRYLKHTAVPTIFTFSHDHHETQAMQEEWSNRHARKKKSFRKGKKMDHKEADMYVKHSPPLKKKSVLLKLEDRREVTASLECIVNEKTLVEGEENTIENMTLEKLFKQQEMFLQMQDPCISEFVTEEPSNQLKSVSLEFSSESDSAKEHDLLNVTAQFICENSEKNSTQAKQENLVRDNNSFIIIPVHEEQDLKKTVVDMETKIYSYASYILHSEHSYCRQDTDRDHLWNKIASLHAKITQLEKKEEVTLAKLNSLASLINNLKQENIVSEEKLKALENYFTTLEFAVV